MRFATGSEPIIGPNYTAERITLSVHRDGKEVARLTPERRHYSVHHEHERTWISVGMLGDLYVVLGEKMGPGAYAMAWLHHKPLVRWIWLRRPVDDDGRRLRLLARRPLLASHPAPATAPYPSAEQESQNARLRLFVPLVLTLGLGALLWLGLGNNPASQG